MADASMSGATMNNGEWKLPLDVLHYFESPLVSIAFFVSRRVQVQAQHGRNAAGVLNVLSDEKINC